MLKHARSAALALFLVLAASAPSPAQFSSSPQPLAPNPVAIGGPIGSPTYVVPPSTKAGGFINVGQAFNEAVGPYVDALVQAAIAALVGWVVLKIKQRTGIEIEGEHRDALKLFLQNQAASLIADGKVKLDGVKVHVDDEALANSANQALARVPDAMKAFGLTPETVAARIVDAVPQITAGASIIAQAHQRAAAAPAPAPKAGA